MLRHRVELLLNLTAQGAASARVAAIPEVRLLLRAPGPLVGVSSKLYDFHGTGAP